MEQSVLFKEAGRNRQLTERDRELLSSDTTF